MTTFDIAQTRLHNHHLIGTLFKKSEEVVHHLGAMQAQDYYGALWALGQRMENATEKSVEQSFNDGKFLRTHVMRPTWHFVHADDIRWLLLLTGPRVHAFNAYYYRKVGLDDALLQLSKTVLTRILQGGKQLTRDEISEALQKAGVKTTGMSLRFPYILMHAELDGLICSGPRIGKQFTYMLLEERVPKNKRFDQDEALAELTKRYFTSHGPATIQDFSWWSGLTLTDVKKGIEMAKLEQEVADGKTYWFFHTPSEKNHPSIVHLLPNYDEFVIAYTDRSANFSAKLTKSPSYQDLSYHFITLNGQIVGGWKRETKKDETIIKANLFMPFDKSQQQLFDDSAERLRHFLGMSVRITD